MIELGERRFVWINLDYFAAIERLKLALEDGDKAASTPNR
jgi:hypothetical protein